MENDKNKGIALYLRGLTSKPTQQEIDAFIYTCESYELDPNFGECHLVPMGGRHMTVIGHPALIKIAHESGNFGGMVSGVVKEGDDFQTSATGVNHTRANSGGAILGAYCAVTPAKSSLPVICYVEFKEFNSGRSNWAKMPAVMITKVAEAFALRRAFHISGVYIHEEMEQMDTPKVSKPTHEDVQAPTPPPAHMTEQAAKVSKSKPSKSEPAKGNSAALKKLIDTAFSLVDVMETRLHIISKDEADKTRALIRTGNPDKLTAIINKATEKIEDVERKQNIA